MFSKSTKKARDFSPARLAQRFWLLRANHPAQITVETNRAETSFVDITFRLTTARTKAQKRYRSRKSKDLKNNFQLVLSFARIPSNFEIAPVVKQRVDGFRILPSFVGAGELAGGEQKRIGKLASRVPSDSIAQELWRELRRSRLSVMQTTEPRE